MSLTALCLTSFALGLQHALEPDHVAAVAALSTRTRTLRRAILKGIVWGTGHALALLAFAGTFFVLRRSIPEALERGLEGSVGLLLIALGLHVGWRLHRDRVHFHVHRHEQGPPHFHAHSHRDARLPHGEDPHEHQHRGLSWRTLLIGLAHGLAGSSALLVVAASTADSPLDGLLLILVFGLGAIAGMAALSTVLTWPARRGGARATALYGIGRWAVTVAAVAIGARLVWASWL